MRVRIRFGGSMVAAILALFVSLPTGAVKPRWTEGTAVGFPAIVDPETGKLLARGLHRQWLARGKLHVVTQFDFMDGRRVEETSEFRQQPELAQQKWHWVERRGEDVMRSFEVDFATGAATGMKMDGGKKQTWAEKLDLPAGTSFAGGGFSFAVKNLVQRLDRGETVELTAVGITPKPRTVRVKITKSATGPLQVSGRDVDVVEVTIHPEIPWVARPFVNAPDNRLWFYRGPPVAFLRAEGPLMEPSDPVVRINVEPPGNPAASGP